MRDVFENFHRPPELIRYRELESISWPQRAPVRNHDDKQMIVIGGHGVRYDELVAGNATLGLDDCQSISLKYSFYKPVDGVVVSPNKADRSKEKMTTEALNIESLELTADGLGLIVDGQRRSLNSVRGLLSLTRAELDIAQGFYVATLQAKLDYLFHGHDDTLVIDGSHATIGANVQTDLA